MPGVEPAVWPERRDHIYYIPPDPGRPDQRIFPRYLPTVFFIKRVFSHVFSDIDNSEVIDAGKYLSASDPALVSSLSADLSSSAPGGPGATFHHRRIPTKLTSREPGLRPARPDGGMLLYDSDISH